MKSKGRIILLGMMASGKSTIGKILAEELSCSFVDIDEYIEKQTNMTVHKIFKEQGEEYFRQLEHQCLNEFKDHDNIVIASGGGIIAKENSRTLIKNYYTSVYINVSIDELEKRLSSKEEIAKRPLLCQGNVQEKLEYFIKKRAKLYNMADIILNPIEIAFKSPYIIACIIKERLCD